MTLQLRYLQTLLELGSSQASTIVFPLPIDLLEPLVSKNARTTDGAVDDDRPHALASTSEAASAGPGP
jgi:hypothetical protein